MLHSLTKKEEREIEREEVWADGQKITIQAIAPKLRQLTKSTREVL
jgi:hypothetical protein